MFNGPGPLRIVWLDAPRSPRFRRGVSHVGPYGATLCKEVEACVFRWKRVDQVVNTSLMNLAARDVMISKVKSIPLERADFLTCSQILSERMESRSS